MCHSVVSQAPSQPSSQKSQSDKAPKYLAGQAFSHAVSQPYKSCQQCYWFPESGGGGGRTGGQEVTAKKMIEKDTKIKNKQNRENRAGTPLRLQQHSQMVWSCPPHSFSGRLIGTNERACAGVWKHVGAHVLESPIMNIILCLYWMIEMTEPTRRSGHLEEGRAEPMES